MWIMQKIYLNVLFVFQCYRTEDADILFQEAAQKNLTGAGYAWIVTEQALEAPNVPLGLYTISSSCYSSILAKCTI